MYSEWLLENYAKFNYKPYIVECKSKGKYQYMIIQFEHIPHMFFRIDSSGQAVMFVYECQQYWDIIFDCDLFSAKTPDGKYYCKLCNEYRKSTGKQLKFWNSSQNMWNEHVFDAMLQWCNANFSPLSIIACYGIPGEASWGAHIVLIEDKNNLDKYSTLLPIVNPLHQLKKEL